ncbi:MAG: PEP-CTERM sorting domain-containing protein [Oceanipulchritudo sp.]
MKNKPITRICSVGLLGVLLGAAGSLNAAIVVYDGASDGLYKATTDNANMALTNPSSGTYTLTNNSASAQGGYLFGNFAATALADGESITLGFTISSIPAITPLTFSLSGARGGEINTTDVGFQEFARAYAGFYQSQNEGNTGMDVQAFVNGPTTNLTEDRQILTGALDTSMDDGDITLTGADRFDDGKTADITMSLVRVGSDFRVDYTLSMAGGSGIQSFSSALFTPSGDYFGTGDAFTTFAIGYFGGVAADSFDAGEAMTLSNITVTAVPEPSSFALLAGMFGCGLVLLRRRRRG